MKLKINWQKPVTELDHVILTILLWYDIWKHGYTNKWKSKYFKYTRKMIGGCPLCQYYDNCGLCFLPVCADLQGSHYRSWLTSAPDYNEGAKEIYLLCKQKAKELIKE